MHCHWAPAICIAIVEKGFIVLMKRGLGWGGGEAKRAQSRRGGGGKNRGEVYLYANVWYANGSVGWLCASINVASFGLRFSFASPGRGASGGVVREPARRDSRDGCIR